MKHKLSYEVLHEMSDNHQDILASALDVYGCSEGELISNITIGKLIEIIREYHQMEIYTVDTNWCVHLFEPDVAANEIGVSCIYENYREELIEILFAALVWTYDNGEVNA